MIIFGALKKRHGDRNLAVGRHGKPRKRTQGNGASRKKLTATRRGTTRGAGVAWRKEHGRDNVAPRTEKGRKDEKRRWQSPECKNGIRNQCSRQELRL
jgi:hypothetical protein